MGYAPHSSKALLCPPSPQGEGYKKGNFLNFKQFATVRYKTGDSFPPRGSHEAAEHFFRAFLPQEKKRKGEGYIKATISILVYVVERIVGAAAHFLEIPDRFVHRFHKRKSIRVVFNNLLEI